MPCPTFGATCAVNSTLSSIALLPGYWRLSPRSLELSLCNSRTVGGTQVSACRGGSVAGVDGGGYCAPGHRGPLCQVCEAAYTHFDPITTQCEACPTVESTLGVPAVAGAAAALVFGLAALLYRSPPRALRETVHRLRRLRSKVQDLQLLPRLYASHEPTCMIRFLQPIPMRVLVLLRRDAGSS